MSKQTYLLKCKVELPGNPWCDWDPAIIYPDFQGPGVLEPSCNDRQFLSARELQGRVCCNCYQKWVESIAEDVQISLSRFPVTACTKKLGSCSTWSDFFCFVYLTEYLLHWYFGCQCRDFILSLYLTFYFFSSLNNKSIPMQILVPVLLPTAFPRLSWGEQNCNFSKGYKRRLEMKKLLLLFVEVHC